MEDKNTVTYFLFNDREGTSRCSFILVALLLYSNSILVLLTFCPLLYPKHGTILFYLLSLSFSNHPYFIATPPPIRLLFALLHLNILPYIKKNFSISILSLPISSTAPIFSTFIPAPFFFSNHLLSPLVYLLLNPNQKSFSTPPQSPCTKAWQLYRAIAMTLLHKSSAIAT